MKNNIDINLVSDELTVVLVTFNPGKLNPLKTRTQPNIMPDSITITEPRARAPARAAFIKQVWNTITTNEKKKLNIC